MDFEATVIALALLGVLAAVALLWRATASRRDAAVAQAERARQALGEFQIDARLASDRLAAAERHALAAQAEIATLRERLSTADARAASLQSTLENVQPRFVELGEKLAASDVTARQLQRREIELTAHNAQLSAQVANAAREIERMQAWVNESTEALRAQMAEIAGKVINDSTTQFRAESKEQLELMLKPFDKDLSAFREKIEQLYLDETKERTSLQGEVRRLAEASSKVSQDAQTLAIALRGDSRARGNWGEVVLARVLEMSGLREGHEYFSQHHLADEDGTSGRLDILIRLPQQRCVVIDSKVSLVAYDRYVNASAEEDSAAFVKAHMDSLRTHVKGLASKEYAKRFGDQAIEYVLLFVPIEPALMLALQHDVELQAFAHDRNIVLVSPNTLMAMLKTIDYLWRVERRTRNSEEIAARAGKLIDSIAQAGVLLMDLKRQLATVDCTMKKFDDRFTGRKGLFTHARLIQELGAKGTRMIPRADEAAEPLDEGDRIDAESDESDDSIVPGTSAKT